MIRDRKEEKEKKKQVAHDFQQFSTIRTAPSSSLWSAGLLPKRLSKRAEERAERKQFP